MAERPPLQIVRQVDALRATTAAWRKAGLRVGLVPTMGALHAGHMALVEELSKHVDRVVVSVFVNPTQFAPHEDFDAYPRTEAADIAKLTESSCALVFAPNRSEMYPDGFSSQVSIGGPAAAGLEAASRPHFFGGVATVVTKLLLQAGPPDAAAFGEKDYQQLQVIKHLVRDLNIPTRIIGVPTLREPDGLAMSSRNAYLNEDERKIAGRMNVILQNAAKRCVNGAAADLAGAEAADALRVAGFDSVDYVVIADADTLAPLGQSHPSKPARILAAARVGKTRLIDNFPVG